MAKAKKKAAPKGEKKMSKTEKLRATREANAVPADAPKDEHRRQPFLPGTEPPTDKELDKLIGAHISDGSKRGQLGDSMKKRIPLIMARMRQIGVKVYPYIDGEVRKKVKLTTGEKIQIVNDDEDEDLDIEDAE